MTARVEIGAGVLTGTLVAGPVFTTLLAGGLALFGGGNGGSGESVWAIPALILVSIPFGAMLAFLPVALGASAMASLGVANEGARLPVLWMLAGAAGAAAPAWVFINNDAGTATLFGATGAICALAARWRTRWPEPSSS